ncbi:MAG: aminotransferase class V-fold PLP-dependent enzyme [Candidatus Kapaibacteriota bacterium]
MLTSQKHLFSLPDSVHYLNCAYMSPLLKSVEEAGFRGVAQKRLPYLLSTDDFFAPPAEVRALFARLINAPNAGNVTLIPSVSYGMAIVAKNLVAQSGQNIVTVSGEFPSNVYAWKEHCDNGVKMRFVAPPTTWGNTILGNSDFDSEYSETRGERWNDMILEAIDENTALVVLCPSHWADGTLFDLEIIGNAARSVGAMFVVDGTQSIGALPFDVQQIQPDALICASYKCMMGAYSIGCAYWGERFAGGKPIEETWIGRVGSDDFRNLVQYENRYQTGMIRFAMGEQSNFVLIPMLNAALTQLLEWQPGRVQEYCADLNTPLVEFCQREGFWIEEQHWRTEHLFGIRIPNELPIEKLQAALSRRHVFVSLRGESIRVAPSVYNTPDDITALIEALHEALN